MEGGMEWAPGELRNQQVTAQSLRSWSALAEDQKSVFLSAWDCSSGESNGLLGHLHSHADIHIHIIENQINPLKEEGKKPSGT